MSDLQTSAKEEATYQRWIDRRNALSKVLGPDGDVTKAYTEACNAIGYYQRHGKLPLWAIGGPED